MDRPRFTTFQQLLKYNADWIRKPEGNSLINGTPARSADLASIDTDGELLAQINELGYLTDSSQSGVVEDEYMERAYLSGWMKTDKAEALSDRLNLDGYICLHAPMHLMIELEKASERSSMLRDYINSTKIPVTAVRREYQTWVGVMPETGLLNHASENLKATIEASYCWIICVDANHGMPASHPQHGLFTKVKKFLSVI